MTAVVNAASSKNAARKIPSPYGVPGLVEVFNVLLSLHPGGWSVSGPVELKNGRAEIDS